jgi:polysaccharide deacetylase family protein (PEP-CTERM system associated)
LEVLALPTDLHLHPAAVPVPAVGGPTLNALTIDVEDYFHVAGFEGCVSRSQWDDFPLRVADNVHRLLDIFAEARVSATFFILGWVAERRPDLVKDVRAAGHEIGSHGHWHKLIYRQTPAKFRADLRRARDVLQDILGEAVTAYRAPCFSITRESLWALDVLTQEGVLLDSSIYPARHDRYGIPGAPLAPHRIARPSGSLWEFPPPVHSLFGRPVPVGGGGWFRLYPYGLTRRWLRAVNRAGRPFAAYFHPWEIDADQPRMRPGRLAAFRHYVNLRRTEGRLVRLLCDFRFGTLSESLAAWRHEWVAAAAA